MKTRVKIGQLVAALWLAGSASVSWAQSAADELTELLKGYERYSAEFEQVTKGDNARRPDVSTGKMYIARPGKFRWETQTPFPQLIISDGQHLWIYDPDLEQATRKPVNPKEANAAALILNGNVQELAQQYSINMPIAQNNERLFDLLPKEQNSNFQRIRIYFSEGVMTELMLQDLLGQQTTIMLRNPQVNGDMPAKAFEFTPPEGTDIIISDAP